MARFYILLQILVMKTTISLVMNNSPNFSGFRTDRVAFEISSEGASVPSSPLPKYCINCKHFGEYNIYDNYDNSIIGITSRCSKFITKNPISGIIKADSAIKCRNNEKMCGINAKYFISKNSSSMDKRAESLLTTNLVGDLRSPDKFDKPFFTHKNMKACIDCKFGMPYISNNPFDERDSIDSNYKCKKFVIRDIVSSKEEILLAKKCRNNESMCGINAKYFIDSKDNETNECT
jgi:hypothetical protein